MIINHKINVSFIKSFKIDKERIFVGIDILPSIHLFYWGIKKPNKKTEIQITISWGIYSAIIYIIITKWN